MRLGTRLRSILESEATKLRQLKILTTAVKFKETNWPQNEELLVDSERFVDSWVEETFILILTAFHFHFISFSFIHAAAMASIIKNMNWRCFTIGGSRRQLRPIRQRLEH